MNLINTYRLFLYATLIVVGAAANMQIMKHYRINYSYIFEIRPKMNDSYLSVYISSFIMCVAFAGCLFLQLIMFHFFWVFPNQDKWPTVLLIVTFLGLIMFNPLDILNRPARIEIVKTIGDISIAPFRPVYFRTFFMADVITSAKPMLGDFCSMACFLDTDEWRPSIQTPQTCGWLKPTSYAWGILPYWWRFWQCIRRCVDDP